MPGINQPVDRNVAACQQPGLGVREHATARGQIDGIARVQRDAVSGGTHHSRARQRHGSARFEHDRAGALHRPVDGHVDIGTELHLGASGDRRDGEAVPRRCVEVHALQRHRPNPAAQVVAHVERINGRADGAARRVQLKGVAQHVEVVAAVGVKDRARGGELHQTARVHRVDLETARLGQ